ncbi:MAG: winged helix-turn-helix domain-containing protein [Aeromonadaceae bacterium]
MVIEKPKLKILVIDRESGFLEIKGETVKGVNFGKREVSALAVLLTSNGRRCPKSKLKEALWPHRIHVDDNQVAAVISGERKSLKKGHLPLSLKAITNYGYQVTTLDDYIIELELVG